MVTRDTGSPEHPAASRATRARAFRLSRVRPTPGRPAHGLPRPLAGCLALVLAGCGLFDGGGGGADPAAAARASLAAGDLPAAAAELDRLVGQGDDSVEVAVAAAWSRLVRGDLAGADAALARVEPSAGDRAGGIRLRRALVALKAGNLDAVKTHAAASGLPQGRLLAAEVHLVDLESDEAAAILRDLAGTGGEVGATAARYLELLDSGDTIRSGLAEAQALWALGDRAAACDAAGELVRSLSADDPTRAEQLLLWAGRAVTSGQADVARSLLDEVDFPPEGQAWRVQATRALVHVAEGEVDEAVRLLDALVAGGAPADGVADARATACALVKDPEQASRLVADLATPAAARCLAAAGASSLAAERAAELAARWGAGGRALGAFLEAL